MRKIFKNKKIIIFLAVLIPILVLISIFISNYPLFYLSDVTVDRVEFYKGGLNELDEYNQYKLCKILSSMNVGKREKYETKIVTSIGGYTYNVRIKLCFNKSVYVRISTSDTKHITINSKHVYECSKEDVLKIIDILERQANKDKY